MVAVDGVGVRVVLLEGFGDAGAPGALGVACVWGGGLDFVVGGGRRGRRMYV